MKTLNNYFSLFISLMISLLIFAACSPSAEEAASSGNSSSGSDTVSENSVAFVYIENSADYNDSHLHEIGRQYLAEKLPDVTTKLAEEVAVEDAEETIRGLAEEGYKLIFATAPEYSDAVLAVAKDFPETYFEVAKGSETADNVATYDGRMYQVFYIMGGYTGEMTVSGKIGFVAAEPTAEVISHINALTLSSLLIRTCEDVTINVRWTGSWDDPEANRKAAEELVELGADVLVQHTYSPEVQKVAEEAGIRSVGYGFDMREFAPTANMTSIIWQWGWYYEQRVNDLLEGKWEAEAYLGKVSPKNFGRGIVDLAPYDYEQIPQIMEAPPVKWRVSYNETNNDALDGPIYSQNGDLVLAKKDKFPDEYIFTGMDWFIQGVVGDAPGEPPETVDGVGANISC